MLVMDLRNVGAEGRERKGPTMATADADWQVTRSEFKIGPRHRRDRKTIMTNIVNLRQARKAKARADKAQTAQENRARFGRTQAQRLADAQEEQRRAALLDGARRAPEED
jgi:hypothetical protein